MDRLTNKKLAIPNNVFISPKTEEERRAYTELARGVDIRAIYTRLAELEDKIEKGTLQEIPEGAVVLTEDCHKALVQVYEDWRERCTGVVDEARKKTAKEILQELYNEATSNICDTVELTAFEIEQRARQYGVEVDK